MFRLSPRQTLFRSRYERFRWKFSNFAAKQTLTMEQKFGKNSIDIKVLREFCEREGKMVEYRKGEQLEREGDPARWFGFVTEGCFKYVTYGISDDKEHITWFSFEGEFAGDYPACLDGGPALTTIEAMVPTRIIRVSGEQLEREGDPARWFGFVTEGCFKYVTHGISDDKEHITWFSFEGEFAGDYPACLDGRPSQTTIKAMMPSRMLRVSGEQLVDFFRQDAEKMELRSVIAEHLLSQARACYLDLHRATARERYELLLQRCPGIVEYLDLQDIASFLNVTPKTISMIRKDITFGKD